MTATTSDKSRTSRQSALILGADGSVRPADKYDGPMLMADKGEVQFHVMVKPAGSACNLSCAYCFYLSKATLPDGPGSGRMSDETLELLIHRYIEDVTAGEVVFSWQGGEPTLLGLDFFRKVVELERQHAKPGQAIQNDLQTNGTLIDEEWCRFFAAERFFVGLSLDGPKELHDGYRVDKQKRPSHRAVVQAFRLLQRHRVHCDVLCVVHDRNVREPAVVYRYFKELGARFLQFLPLPQGQRSLRFTRGAAPASCARNRRMKSASGAPERRCRASCCR